MIHKACMPVYMNSGKIVADGRDGTGRVGNSKVLQEVLADLKRCNMVATNLVLCNASFETSENGNGMCVIWQIERKQREY